MTDKTLGPSGRAVQIADEWLDAHRKGDTWRIVDYLRDEVVRLSDALAAATYAAEARIKAVEKILERAGIAESYMDTDPVGYLRSIRRALDGDS